MRRDDRERGTHGHPSRHDLGDELVREWLSARPVRQFVHTVLECEQRFVDTRYMRQYPCPVPVCGLGDRSDLVCRQRRCSQAAQIVVDQDLDLVDSGLDQLRSHARRVVGAVDRHGLLGEHPQSLAARLRDDRTCDHDARYRRVMRVEGRVELIDALCGTES